MAGGACSRSSDCQSGRRGLSSFSAEPSGASASARSRSLSRLVTAPLVVGLLAALLPSLTNGAPAPEPPTDAVSEGVGRAVGPGVGPTSTKLPFRPLGAAATATRSSFASPDNPPVTADRDQAPPSSAQAPAPPAATPTATKQPFHASAVLALTPLTPP